MGDFIEHYAALVDGLIEENQRPKFRLDPGNGEFQLRTLLKMAEWAVANQPVKVGDIVDLGDWPGTITSSSGWWHWRNHLARQSHVVVDVLMNGAYGTWMFKVVVDGCSFSLPMEWATVQDPKPMMTGVWPMPHEGRTHDPSGTDG